MSEKRHHGKLKIRREQSHVGSIPTSGTTDKSIG
jgi:hypothetical protein